MFNGNGLDVVIMAIVAVVLTSVIKKPIKSKTEKLNEDKRKALNTLIILIPLGIAIIEYVVFYGIIMGIWSLTILLEVVFSVFAMSLSINEIFSKIYSILQAFRNGELSLNDVKEGVESVSKEIKSLIQQSKSTEKELTQIYNQIDKAETVKQKIISSADGINISLFASTNEELKLLKNKENKLKSKVEELKLKISEFCTKESA